MYWCVPGGPLQWVLCMFNPVSCIVCICPMESAKGPTGDAINNVLQANRITCKVESDMTGYFVVFYG